jgi:hypothetical protein
VLFSFAATATVGSFEEFPESEQNARNLRDHVLEMVLGDRRLNAAPPCEPPRL